MANTRQSAKRARQALNRQNRNQIIKSATRSAVRAAMDAVKSKDLNKAKVALAIAVKTLSKAASKGSFPKKRLSRKMSRLTRFARALLPSLFSTDSQSGADKTAS